MADLKALWFHPDTPTNYHQSMNKVASGVLDEKIVADFIGNFRPGNFKVIVDLGIGTGRELPWLDKLSDIEKIIGVDYSPAMLKFCTKRAKDCTHRVVLIKGNLLKPKELAKVAVKEKKSVIYLSLINTFGNFTKEERLLVLRNIKSLLKKSDRIVLALYKRLHYTKRMTYLKKMPMLQTKDSSDQPVLAELIEYGLLPFFWTQTMDRYHQLPKFWYDKETNDVVIHLNGKRLFISHRFTKEEIEQEFKSAGLKVGQIIDGKAMYIAVGKI